MSRRLPITPRLCDEIARRIVAEALPQIGKCELAAMISKIVDEELQRQLRSERFIAAVVGYAEERANNASD